MIIPCRFPVSPGVGFWFDRLFYRHLERHFQRLSICGQSPGCREEDSKGQGGGEISITDNPFVVVVVVVEFLLFLLLLFYMSSGML